MLVESRPPFPPKTQYASAAAVQGADYRQCRRRQADVLECCEEERLVDGGEGHGEVKQKDGRVIFRANSVAASSTSTTLAKMGRPGKNPRCSGLTHAANVGSHL